MAWRGPYKVVGTVGEVDYKTEINPAGKVKTYHISMLKRYFHRENEQKKFSAMSTKEHKKVESPFTN